ncbi:MAG: HNH endonuclease [Prevotellaceae bacterium]|nr:HNH endonuclease [Prevotellaceae bacterium]
MSRITESQLVLPALYLMSMSQDGFISTSDLISKLTSVMHPTGIDAQILPGRKDTYFSQKVRNLKSHDTLVRKELATDHEDGFIITQHGAEYVNTHMEAISYLLTNEFSYEDVKGAFDSISTTENKPLPIEEIISEGRTAIRSIQTRERSARLRRIAIEHFTHNNIISCDCCGFNFPNYYGQKYGKDCIEIHHIRPIFQYEGDKFEKFVTDAMQNLLPVCPNCHRVIHKNHIGSENIEAFKNEIKMRTN